MAFTGKFVYVSPFHLVRLNPFDLRVDWEGWWISSLCHSCGFACQLRVLKAFPGPVYLLVRGGTRLTMAFTGNFSSENVVYLFTCKRCSKQYTGSTEDFRPRFNNYRCAHRNFLKRKKVKKKSFNTHFVEVNHNGEDDWEVRLIDQTDNVEELEKDNLFGNMSWILFSQMDWMSEKWLFFYI